MRQERFGGGASDTKNLDAELASQITRDARFDDNLDYMDDNADKLARKRMKTDAMKRAFAINGELDVAGEGHAAVTRPAKRIAH